MIDAMPTPDAIPAAHTVPDLRVGMTVAVHDAADVERLLGATVELESNGARRMIDRWASDYTTARAAWVCSLESNSTPALMVLPVVCKVVSLPRGETVDAGELRAQAKSVNFGRTEREAWDDVSRVRQSIDALRIHTALQDATARAARLDAGEDDAKGELAGLVRPSSVDRERTDSARVVPSINVHDEVTLNGDHIDAIKRRLAELHKQTIDKWVRATEMPTWMIDTGKAPTGWRWSMSGEPEQRITTASANAGTVKVTSLPVCATWTAEDVKAMQADAPDLRARYEEELRAAETRGMRVDQDALRREIGKFMTQHPEMREHFKATGMLRRPNETPRASTVADLRFGMEVRVETREDVGALVGRLVKLQGSPGDYEVTGFDSYTCEGHERRLLVAKRGGPIMLPRVFTVRDSSASERDAAGQEFARRAQPSYPDQVKSVQAVTHSRCSDCKDTGILPGFGFGTSIDACDRPCTCDAGKRKAEGGGPSEWTVVERVNVDEADRDRVVTERVTIQRGSQRMHFRIRACAGQRAWTAACVTDETGRRVLRGIGSNYDVEGEACIPMAIDRLLVGLREGTVTP